MDILREVEVAELSVDPLDSAAACDLRDMADQVCQKAKPNLTERTIVVKRRMIERLAGLGERSRMGTEPLPSVREAQGL